MAVSNALLFGYAFLISSVLYGIEMVSRLTWNPEPQMKLLLHIAVAAGLVFVFGNPTNVLQYFIAFFGVNSGEVGSIMNNFVDGYNRASPPENQFTPDERKMLIWRGQAWGVALGALFVLVARMK